MNNGGTWILIIHAMMVVPALGHAVLSKRHSRSALGWIAFLVGYPIVGPITYFFFGVNRVRTRSEQLRDELAGKSDFHRAGEQVTSEHADTYEEFTGLSDDAKRLLRIGASVTTSPVRKGNHVRMLVNGEEAYPAMLEAIKEAEHRIWMTTYIFETNHTGTRFIDALGAARERGVDVRVIIDGVGEWYSRPRASKKLKKYDIPVARYLRPRLFPPQFFINLRNHRKLLMVDSNIGFTGGMNIGGRHMVSPPETDSPVQDMHFAFSGKLVEDMERLFLHDWSYTTHSKESYKPSPGRQYRALDEGVDNAFCRLIPDGPDHDLNKLETVYHSVVAAADHRVTIVTPYFLPTEQMQGALIAAAIRGVDVTVLLPQETNLPYVQAATYRMIRWLLSNQVKVKLQKPPFSHTKLLIVDDNYMQCGSANVDPRSLRLNFELAVEVVQPELIANVDAYLDKKIADASDLTLEDLDNRSLIKRIGDGICWLVSPYL